MTQRQYEPFTLFNVRIADMRHLWNPSDEYKGKKQEKPNYFGGFLVAKTQAQWASEPALAGLVSAFTRLHANNPQIADWRIQDGDLPGPDGKSSEFAKSHWLFNASSSNPINVELVQAGGALVKLPNKVGVKSGDYCMVGGSAAVSGQNSRAVKLYLNAVVFTAPGEEIVFANSVSGAELMAQAQKQGLQVAGFSAAPVGGGFGGPQLGFQNGAPVFAPPGQGVGAGLAGPSAAPAFNSGAPHQPGFQQPGPAGFVPGQNTTGVSAGIQTAFQPQGAFAPQQGAGATAFPSSPFGQR